MKAASIVHTAWPSGVVSPPMGPFTFRRRSPAGVSAVAKARRTAAAAESRPASADSAADGLRNGESRIDRPHGVAVGCCLAAGQALHLPSIVSSYGANGEEEAPDPGCEGPLPTVRAFLGRCVAKA